MVERLISMIPWIWNWQERGKILFDFLKKNKDLEELLLRLHANASNNYKDAAQDNYKQFLSLFQEYKEKNVLKKRQIAYYEEKVKEWEPQMRKYTHFDQKADIEGLRSSIL